MVVDPLELTEPTKGRVVTLKSPNSESFSNLAVTKRASPSIRYIPNGEDIDYLAFDVENPEAAPEQLKRKGVEVIVEPCTIEGGKEAFAKDPNGIWIEFTQQK